MTDGRLEELMTSAKMVNINALRVWGGGIYEKDKFYQLADEKGYVIKIHFISFHVQHLASVLAGT